ncbi:MAG: tyrosine-type recombinase/integrase [Acidimicrobiales bacterium]
MDAGPDAVTGRRRQITRTIGGTKREAHDALSRLLVELGQGRHHGTSAVTVADVCRDWFNQAAPSLQPNTRTEFAGVLDRYLRPRTDVLAEHDVLVVGLGAVPLAKLRAWDLDRFYPQLLLGGGKGGRALSPATVRKVHTLLRLALGQAVRWQWIAENPALHAKPPGVPRPSPKPPPVEDARRLIEIAEELDPDWATFLRLSAALGARRGEVCGLRWSAIDLEVGTVAVHRAVIVTDQGPVERDYPKTASSRRRVSIDAGTVAALEAHRDRQLERVGVCKGRLARDAYVFSAEVDGSRPWHPTIVTHRFKRLTRRAGLEGLRLHDLRHFVATQLIAGGVDVRTVAGRLGHANPNVTLSTYAAWVPARDQDAAKLIGSSLDPGSG